ncbi:MAG: hypothetical protein PHI22_01265 [Bacilli bacterium]|nr:hypothetical protein [Bacilli bacterium]MDD4298637.1 hypothetical protein [Bacilli bacterium]MDD4643502.1 hypothetical protein [Bacilli bacterium]
MNIKNVIITCVVVVLYLSLCSWRFARLEEADTGYNQSLVINVTNK